MDCVYADTASMKMRHFVGPNHSLEIFGTCGPESPRVIEERPLWWGSATLREHADSHLLFWDCGAPIAELPVCAQYFRGGLGNRCFKRREAFLYEREKSAWHLLRVDVLPGSLNLSAEEQIGLIGQTLCVPLLPVLIRAAVALSELTEGKARLYGKFFGRTSSIFERDGNKLRFEFGDFDEEEGFHVWYPQDSMESEAVGLATEILPETRRL